MQIKEYTIIKEHTFDMDNLNGYEELSCMLETRGWTYLNKLIKDTNNSIWFEFYKNSSSCDFKDYMAYVRGKHINYYPITIKILFISKLLINAISKIGEVFICLI